MGKVAYDVLVKDFVDCYHQVTPGSDGGSVSGCAWAAAAFVPGDKIAEGLKITRGTLEARLAEYVRRYSLGVDPAKGLKFNQGEMHSALRVESERGVQLTRDKTGDLEWYDQAGRGYDAVGNSPSECLQIPQFVNSIKAHLLKTEKSGRFASFIPVDVSTYTADQIKAIKAAVKGLPEADQARLFKGTHRTSQRKGSNDKARVTPLGRTGREPRLVRHFRSLRRCGRFYSPPCDRRSGKA
ncbi:hypothetical protein ACIRQQ_32170 [Streptomyces fuscichromogenes]|uniref:hypothetical protein n=1 Tax=Streptomyces fuscichromogenes TaxID=1324013 RepID=UPI00382C6E09